MIPCLFILTAFFVRGAAAQPPEHQGRKERVDRVERFKQMRLIEELQLGEEEAVRFMAKRKEHEDRMKNPGRTNGAGSSTTLKRASG